MIDLLATMTPQEYRTVKAKLEAQGLWSVGGNASKERRSAAEAERIIKGIRN